MKENQIFIILMNFLFIIYFLLSANLSFSQTQEDEKWIVGKFKEADPKINFNNHGYSGIKYFYGVRHVKIETEELEEIIFSYVYNLSLDYNCFLDIFSRLKKGKKYIFIVHKFNPCTSGLLKLQGRCDDFFFYPLNNSIIQKYKDIYTIVRISDYNNRKE